MGEISDGLINGDFDFYTGEYLGRGYGIPRTGNRSLPWERRKGKIGKAKDPKESAYNGVKKYISMRWAGRKDIPGMRELIYEFTGEKNLDIKEKCIDIQKDFKAFINFINQKLKHT